MPFLIDAIEQLFECLVPIRACTHPVEERCLDPLQRNLIGPVQEECVDPVLRTLEVNPLGCLPWIGIRPSLPQDDAPSQQDMRARQLARGQPDYQYNYALVKTFRVERGKGEQGEGIAILDKVPFSQLPSCVWLLKVCSQAMVVIDNLLLVLDLIEQRPLSARRAGETGVAGVPLAISPEEVRQRREDLLGLRWDMTGIVARTRRVANRVPETRDTTVAAPMSTATAIVRDVGMCRCPRCSPETFSQEISETIQDRLLNITKTFVEELLKNPIFERRTSDDIKYNNIEDYNYHFQRIPLPQFAHTFQDDKMFALQRVAGQNPMVIERVEWTKELYEKFPVAPYQYQKVMGDDDSLTAAGSEGRLYLCDYGDSLGNTIAGNFPPVAGQKYINAPLALFALLKCNRNDMRAVAIQAGQQPGKDNPVITPDCGYNWEIAKSIVQNADCNGSEFYQHLGLGHLLIEAFILATYRQLPEEHPLYVLLTPHFQGTLFTNNTAVTSIGEIDSPLNITEAIFSGTVPSTLGIAANAVHRVNFTDNMLPTQLKRRRVDNPELLPHYPYREDALDIWNAIRRWVSDYVDIYYRSDADVLGDYELQNWVVEVGSQNGGRIQGVGEGGKIRTMDSLIDCMTAVIYTASAHHALTNFPLIDYEIYAPGWPGALYREAPKQATGATDKDWLSYLPPLGISILQQALGFVIGTVHATELGQYPLCHFADNRVEVPLRAYQASLRRIEETINTRNETRPLRYPYLLPSRIPQSTDI